MASAFLEEFASTSSFIISLSLNILNRHAEISSEGQNGCVLNEGGNQTEDV